MAKLPEPEEIQAKADAVIEKSTVGRKVRDQMGWTGIVFFGVVLALIVEAIVNKALLA